MVVLTGGGGKGWVGSLEFRSWRFIEREKILILKEGEAAVWRREV